jgi:DNA polymerase-4
MDMDTFVSWRLTNSKLNGTAHYWWAEVWSLLVPMKLGHLVFVLQCLSKWLRLCPQEKKVIWLYSKLSILPKSLKKSTYCEKASIDEFYLILCGMDRFHGCYQDKRTHNQSKRNRIAALHYPLIRRFRNWNRRIKTNRKTRDSRNHVWNLFCPLSKNSDGWWRHFSIIVAHWHSNYSTLSEMPAKCCNKWLAKTVLISGKSGIDNNPGGYTENFDNGTHFGQDTIDIQN